MRLHNHKKLYNKRKKLRNQSTPAEIRLWYYLKNSKIGAKFRRQHSIGPFILDFYSPKYKLAIELDGAAHDHEALYKKDFKRSVYLADQGIKVLRFENRLIFENIQRVVDMIGMNCQSHHPVDFVATPPPSGRRGKRITSDPT
ncbi:MAG TPA: DUF559 domain-containing protein [Candidatus Doudnabacteria bacterium]|nr:DUF559 domain-containing protein [Candidatus Doudnabacteria bacterium]